DRYLTLDGHAEAEFSPDGKRLATAHQDRTARLWDLETKKEVAAFRGHAHLLNGLAFSPDGRRLAAASWDVNRGATGEVKLWDGGAGAEILAWPGHVSVAFSPDGRFLAGVGGDVLEAGVIKVWDGGRLAGARR